MHDWNPKLFLAAARTFEGFCFANPVQDPDGTCRFGGRTVCAAVDFTGPFSGSVRIRMGEEAAKALTANVLGDDVGPECHFDAMKELANVVCGNALPEIAGAEAVFVIGPPYFVERGVAPAQPSAASVAVTLPEGCVEVELFASEPAPAGNRA